MWYEDELEGREEVNSMTEMGEETPFGWSGTVRDWEMG